MTREERLLSAVIDAVDTLVDDYDLIDFLQTLCHRCTELLDVAAVGVMLVDQGGKLHVIAASDEHTRLLELFSIQHDEGPCVETYRDGTARLDIDLDEPDRTAGFPGFAERARHAGFAITHALPMRLRERTVGVMNLFGTRRQPFTETDSRVAHALADVATIAILQHRTLVHGNLEQAQLQAALSSRIVIEQAKGILAEHWQTGVDEAFEGLRRHARAHKLGLTRLSRQVVAGEIDSTDIQHP
ncbi:transcriptional regulator [Streptomyces minutiscleroticus]|uniref:Transcriptional regulator n=1 Tax=Streptomyces minutiscleroticus TaxID=68238 RepID=A0A918NP87_9ACTN|nr:GAF and ANTAR domain-containing protein [Streptomyces minutiscleroticus]GGX84128.1 transcriptional regulator [Streptomyces minutiscleroticus]